jgi:hypothetical protein
LAATDISEVRKDSHAVVEGTRAEYRPNDRMAVFF